jgi:hypothetical protein
MHQISGFFLRSIRDLLTWSVLKVAIFIGVPLMALWVWIGMLSWDYLVAFTSMVIGWIPFSIVKANGALFVIFFIWLVAVLVSFAVVTALIGTPLLRYFKERTHYVYTFVTLLLLSAAWALVLLMKWEWIFAEVQRLLTLLPFQTVAEGSAWLLAFYLLYNGYILTLYIVLSFFRKGVLEPLRLRYYPDTPMPRETFTRTHLLRILRDAILFAIFFALAFPILFVPMANVVVQLLLWSWLYRESYFIATCNLYCEPCDYEALKAFNESYEGKRSIEEEMKLEETEENKLEEEGEYMEILEE